MTRSELTSHLRTLSSGTIAQAIGSTSYRIIDRSMSSAIIYATEQATDAEIAPIDDLSGILSFLTAHKDYAPSWCS